MPEQKRSPSPLALVLGLSAAFFVVFLVISAAIFMSRSGTSSGKKRAGGGSIFKANGSVGVLEVNGVIMDSKRTLRRLERFEEDEDIKAVVVRINSPGGAVGPSQEIYQALRKFKKPVVASMGSVAASGGFYIAVGAKKIYANAGTITGSIGVIMELANLEKLYEWAKIQRFAIKTGKFKDAGADYRQMTSEERALLQGMVDDVLVQFKKAVLEGRKITAEELDPIADGRVMSGSQAKALKLVDELGGITDAIADAAAMAGIKGKPSIVYPERHKGKWLEFLLDSRPSDDDYDSEARASGGLLETLLGGIPALGRASAHALTPGVYWLWKGGY